ncbi:MAG: 2-hydroxyacyl-CoA dehydratase family protein [Candidatus Eremiobacteraeota bacterium]|nr:2-hydroxyacyl-CoA dehydratase family protein [Candidatus Eremiobacteraeota bacterium]
MSDKPDQITLEGWDSRYEELLRKGLAEPWYGGPLRRHAQEGDLRLCMMEFDNSAAALRLWNFLLTEEERLHRARGEGKKIVGVMKDLGTIPVMAYSLPDTVAFYPDGAWWIPCIKQMKTDMLTVADSLGIDDSFCPVRAMVGAFLTGKHFPLPDLLTCSVGATCDDFSAIASRLESMGFPVLWWEIPHRREPSAGEPSLSRPEGKRVAKAHLDFVRSELERVKAALESLAGSRLTEKLMTSGIRKANAIRRLLDELRFLVFTARKCPLPSLELLIAEMLAIHFCSDREETAHVLRDLLREVKRRVKAGEGTGRADAARVFWVNPVADLRAMNLMEKCGARICGTDYLFFHALDEIPEDMPPMEALAFMALMDPMVGTASERALRILHEMKKYGAEGLVISRIPGASHCATEGAIIRSIVQKEGNYPVVEIEVPPLSDSLAPALHTSLEALVEMIWRRRQD